MHTEKEKIKKVQELINISDKLHKNLNYFFNEKLKRIPLGIDNSINDDEEEALADIVECLKIFNERFKYEMPHSS